MNCEEGLTGFYFFADQGMELEADGGVYRVVFGVATGTEVEGGVAEGSGVQLCDPTWLFGVVGFGYGSFGESLEGLI